ncbi:MAG TPA: hypothetical protein VMM14_01755 [Acidimicrobiia bacterium]|nr:hypothetical protein [Acidimicrobiia bacterium]
MVIVPRRFGQVLNDAIVGLGAVWKTLLIPAIVVSVPVSIATIALFALSGGADFIDLIINNPERLQTLPREVFWELARPFYLAMGVGALLQLVGGVFVALTGHSAVAAQLAGAPATTGVVTRRALRRYATGLVATMLIVVTIMIMIGLGTVIWLVPALAVGTPNAASVLVALLLLVVLLGPGVWAGVSASMTTAAIVIEDRSALSAIRRSIQLVRGRWWPTAGFILLVGLIGGIAVQLIQLVALPLVAVGGGGAAVSIASALGIFAQGLLVAAIAAMYTHWYVDLRARKEGLSTESLG